MSIYKIFSSEYFLFMFLWYFISLWVWSFLSGVWNYLACNWVLIQTYMYWFLNLNNIRRFKYFSQHTYHLWYWSLLHHPACIQIQIHGFKILQSIWSHLRFPKAGKHSHHPGKFKIVYAAPCATLDKNIHPSRSAPFCKLSLQLTKWFADLQ